MHHVFSLPCLYILSGTSHSGKKSFLDRCGIPHSMIVSEQLLYEQFFGGYPKGDQNVLYGHYISHARDIIANIVESRLSEKLTTFVNALLLTEKDRQYFAKIAEKYHMRCEVLLFDLNETRSREKNKKAFYIGPSLDRQFKIFENETTLPHRRIYKDDTGSLHVPKIEGAWDIVGDLHGNFNAFADVVKQLGYQANDDGGLRHPDGRKLLFLGDINDRGPCSVALLRLIKKNVEEYGHEWLMGNHEYTIIQYHHQLQKGQYDYRTMGASVTLKDWIHLSDSERNEMLNFLHRRPIFVTYERKGLKWILCHADIPFFDGIQVPKSVAIYGAKEQRTFENDRIFQENHSDKYDWRLIRGHDMPSHDIPENRVLSLENGGSFGGCVRYISIDKWADALANDETACWKDYGNDVATEFHFKSFCHSILPSFDIKNALRNREIEEYTINFKNFVGAYRKWTGRIIQEEFGVYWVIVDLLNQPVAWGPRCTQTIKRASKNVKLYHKNTLHLNAVPHDVRIAEKMPFVPRHVYDFIKSNGYTLYIYENKLVDAYKLQWSGHKISEEEKYDIAEKLGLQLCTMKDISEDEVYVLQRDFDLLK